MRDSPSGPNRGAASVLMCFRYLSAVPGPPHTHPRLAKLIGFSTILLSAFILPFFIGHYLTETNHYLTEKLIF